MIFNHYNRKTNSKENKNYTKTHTKVFDTNPVILMYFFLGQSWKMYALRNCNDAQILDWENSVKEFNAN